MLDITIGYLTWNLFSWIPISAENVKTTMALPAQGQTLACTTHKYIIPPAQANFKVIYSHSEISAIYTQLMKNSHCAHTWGWVYTAARGQRPQLRFNRKTACQHVGQPAELSQWKHFCVIPSRGVCVGHFACSTPRPVLSSTDSIVTTAVCALQEPHHPCLDWKRMKAMTSLYSTGPPLSESYKTKSKCQSLRP